jgi:hypothetical protein
MIIIFSTIQTTDVVYIMNKKYVLELFLVKINIHVYQYLVIESHDVIHVNIMKRAY